MKSNLESFLFDLSLTYDLSGDPDESMRLLEAIVGEYLTDEYDTPLKSLQEKVVAYCDYNILADYKTKGG